MSSPDQTPNSSDDFLPWYWLHPTRLNFISAPKCLSSPNPLNRVRLREHPVETEAHRVNSGEEYQGTKVRQDRFDEVIAHSPSLSPFLTVNDKCSRAGPTLQ
jgi:hypothetical protein